MASSSWIKKAVSFMEHFEGDEGVLSPKELMSILRRG